MHEPEIPNHIIMRSATPWARGPGFGCAHCGAEFIFDMPVTLSILFGAAEGFGREHAKCEPSADGAARFTYRTPDEWLHSWDTGLSALTIYAHFTGLPLSAVYGSFWRPGKVFVPEDAASFARCHRLLAVAPEWRARIAEMGKRFEAWRPIVEAWDEHEARWKANPEVTGGALHARVSVDNLTPDATGVRYLHYPGLLRDSHDPKR